ncbi:anion transporting atpase [Pyrococcus sp. NA2]|uniref:ArsA family ATPase n=1 Tax=Pyrococcus sp. (strain NA2) TaxID=342949 RepID=UPI000209AFFD|nr:ArsA family ATPase [Pyrococcus sp. NA2]AEC52398.1 anion transporting atpase [Pyrococcus sp. NA2]
MKEFLKPVDGFRVIFVIGKGGVGKTTTSASLSVALARKGYKTLVVSLDPAHNLGDVFMEKLNNKPREIMENLYASELDMEGMIKEYLEHLEKTMKMMYRYLTVINLEKYFEVLRYSPGIEEYATLEAIREILLEGDEWDVIVFDTPPTGLTLRVLALPKISLIWTDKLIELRRKILERRRAIEKIQGERRFVVDGKEIRLASREEEDAVMRELNAYREEIMFVYNVLTNPKRTAVIAVMNPEMLSLYETKRAYESLREFKIPFNMIVINKIVRMEIPEIKGKIRTQEKIISEVKKTFKNVEIIEIPMFQEEPRGIEWLEKVGGMIIGDH